MKKSKFSERHIIKVLKEIEQVPEVPDVLWDETAAKRFRRG